MSSNEFIGSAGRKIFLVDDRETYGRHIIKKISSKINPNTCLDLGASDGQDLTIVKQNNKNCKLYGVDFKLENKILKSLGVDCFKVDLERDDLPVNDKSIDLIIANQVMEHLKEIYWINHQIFKKLKVGGYFFMGVPNILALHNRILSLIGYHPSCIKMISAHIRGFSIKDTLRFYNTIGKDFLKIERVYGSQFYPLPRRLSRVASSFSPALSTAIFFLIRKTNAYDKQFISWVEDNDIPTSYYIG